SMHPNPRGLGPSYSLQHRSTTNGTMSSSGNNIGPVASSFPRYLRLVRSGDEISAYTSSTNGNWALLGSRTIQMPNTIYVGLAVTSHDNGTLNLSEFDSVSVQVNTNSFQSNVSDFDGFAGISSAKANNGDNIVLTPNPTSDFVDITLPSEASISRIRVFGYNGRLLRTVETNEIGNVSVYTLDVRELPTGIYIINALNDLGETFESRLVIQR
ncbi:MAG: T9SS type A sorting domain-containing protein, partial [Bacteroidota bacterium]